MTDETAPNRPGTLPPTEPALIRQDDFDGKPVAVTIWTGSYQGELKPRCAVRVSSGATDAEVLDAVAQATGAFTALLEAAEKALGLR